MSGRREWMGRTWRLALFAVVAAGAVAFVLRTRGTEFGSTPQASERQLAKRADASGYYILFGLARQRAEAQEEAVLKTILMDGQASQADRARASADLAGVARSAREEGEIQSVMAGQGLAPSAVVISNQSAMVVVPAAEMSDRAAREIATDLWNLAGIAPEHVLIRPGP